MKMNPKAEALNAMAEEGGNYKEPMNKSEDNAEDTQEGESNCNCVKCSCGAELMCADCKQPACDCNCEGDE